ncbi:MAG: MarR family transcriptional regulator [Smithellaceae bacterium]|nr:MarR family transcriptional regulator [Smithellaceae bacterium]
MKKNKDNQVELIDVFIGLAQATRCCRQDTAFCGGVTFHQFVILDAVAKNKELKISDLHSLLAVEKSTTTRLLNPLLAKGLLNKAKSISDSRAFVLTLTKNGRETHHRVQACLEDFFSKVAGNLPANKQEIILQAVQTFISAIKNASGTFNCCS